MLAEDEHSAIDLESVLFARSQSFTRRVVLAALCTRSVWNMPGGELNDAAVAAVAAVAVGAVPAWCRPLGRRGGHRSVRLIGCFGPSRGIAVITRV
jgi:hypothetical protein